jgi:hypothetical protein
MWNPPMALTPEEQNRVARTRKTRKCFVFLRERRPEMRDAAFQHTLAQSSSAAPGGKAPVEAGRLALATLLQASCHGGDRDAVALTVMDQRWQRGRDGLGAEQPPCSPSTLCHFRRRLIAHHLDKTLWDRTVAWAEQTGGFGARQLRAVVASTPLFGAGRVADPWTLLGQALRQAVGLAAQELGTSTEAVVEDAGLTLRGHRSLQAALDLDWGEPRARARALGLGLEEVARWPHGLAPPQTLAAEPPPLQEGMETITQMSTQETEPDPGGRPGVRRLTPHVAADRRIAIEENALRHGRTSRAKTFTGFQEPCAVAWASTGIREVVVRPANEPEQEAVERRAEEWEKTPGMLQLASDLGSMASPRMAPWEAQGVSIIARPWPQGGPWFTKNDGPVAFARLHVTCPGGQSVPMGLGKPAPLPAAVCDGCPLRAQWTQATCGQGRSRRIRADELFQQQLRAKMTTRCGRASLRKRTAVEHTMAHPWRPQGRRARDKGLRKNQFDGRRHAAVSNLQVAAHDEEQHRLAS